jgi:anti-anti-sigma factor
MEISTERLEGDITCIRLVGRLDIRGTAAIEDRLAALLAGVQGGCILDVARVTFLASIGIRAILINAKALQRRGGRLVILDPIPDVAQVLSITGIDTVIPVCLGMEAARAAAIAA